MQRIGLLGGMSWESTAHYYTRINQLIGERLGGLHSARLLLYSVEFDEIQQLQHADDWDGAGRILADALAEFGAARRLAFLESGGGTLTLRAYASSQAAVLEIADTGAGISPEIRDKIFNLYFTTKKSGSGIGLALTFRALQLHNGAVELASEAGVGACFRLLLPLAQGDRQGLRQFLDALRHHRRERMVILVVDHLDDPNQLAAAFREYRCHQHLLGAITGAFVDVLQETQMRAV